MKRLLFILSIVLLWSRPILGNVSLFEAKVDYEVDEAGKIMGADLDNDNDNDLILEVLVPGGVSVLVNNGGGFYSSPVGYGAGSNPKFVVKADYDGDGSIDLALVDYSDSILTFINNGDGTFAPGQNFEVISPANDVFASDLDGDADIDILLFSSFYDGIFTYLNDGTGVFSYDGYYALATSEGGSIFGADFDGDGDIDVAVAAGSEDAVYILPNNGDATFAAAAEYGTGMNNPTDIDGADFDGDGDCDLAVGHSNLISLLVNSGDGTFSPPVDVSTAPSFLISCSDYDADGDVDLMTGVGSIGSVSAIKFLSNNGDGTFTDLAFYAVEDTNVVSFYGADIDGDNHVDLATTDLSHYKVSLLFNNGDGGYPVPYSYDGPRKAVSGFDIDGDGNLDLVGIRPGFLSEPFGWIDGAISVSMNNGDGTYAPVVESYGFQDPVDLFNFDFDGDGDVDLAVSDVDNTLRILINDGSGAFTWAQEIEVENPSSVSGADFDNDGDCDLAAAVAGPYGVSIWVNDGDGSFVFADNYSAEGYIPSMICVDLNGDTYSDLVTVNQFGPPGLETGYISAYLNNGDGTFGTAVSYEAGLNPVSVFAGDFNGDLVQDLAVANLGAPYGPPGQDIWSPVYGNISVLSGNGDGSFSPPVDYLSGYSCFPESVFGEDFDADGDCDLAVRIGRKNGGGGLFVLFNDGSGLLNIDVNYGLDIQTEDLSPSNLGTIVGGDVDGDGDIDLVASPKILINTTNGGSCTNDSDCDGVANGVDNCPHTDNPNQTDTDGDGVGDLCDRCPGYDDLADADGDGAPDSCDNCPEAYNPEQDNTDTDADGVPDVCDICPGFDDNLDSDGDGIPDGCDDMCGDASGDAAVNIGDAVYLITYIFKGGPAPEPLCVGDASGDDTVNVGDAVYLINFIFKGGPPPTVNCCL